MPSPVSPAVAKLLVKSPDDGQSKLALVLRSRPTEPLPARMTSFSAFIFLNPVEWPQLTRRAAVPSTVVITMALRTPLCKAKKGSYKDMEADELLLSFFTAIIPQLGCDPALVEDIVIGNVICPGIAYVGEMLAS